MAAGGNISLTDSEIERLAREMDMTVMESIAIADLGIAVETVNNLKVIHQGNYIGFNRDLLILWRNNNTGIDQVQVSQKINVIPLSFNYYRR